MQVSTEVQDTVVTVRVDGEVDLATAAAVTAGISDAIDRPGATTVVVTSPRSGFWTPPESRYCCAAGATPSASATGSPARTR